MIPPLYAPEESTTSNVVAVPKSMMMRSPSCLACAAITFSARSAPTLCGSSTSSTIGHAAAPCPATSGSRWKYLEASTSKVVKRAGNDGADDHRFDIGLRIAFELEQLMKPHRIFVRRAPRVGRDAPPRPDLARLDQGKDQVGVPGIDREQHARPLGQARLAAKRLRKQVAATGTGSAEATPWTGALAR